MEFSTHAFGIREQGRREGRTFDSRPEEGQDIQEQGRRNGKIFESKKSLLLDNPHGCPPIRTIVDRARESTLHAAVVIVDMCPFLPPACFSSTWTWTRRVFCDAGEGVRSGCHSGNLLSTRLGSVCDCRQSGGAVWRCVRLKAKFDRYRRSPQKASATTASGHSDIATCINSQ